MAKIIKYIKFILLQISTILIKSKWRVILSLVSGVIMSIITFFQNINIAYSIPIIIFVMGAIPWGILCYIKVYKLFCNKPVLEIIYDNGKFNREDILVKHNYLRKYYVCIIAIFNKSTKTVSSVRVFMETKGTPQITLLHFDTNKNMCDINPGATELFKWVN